MHRLSFSFLLASKGSRVQEKQAVPHLANSWLSERTAARTRAAMDSVLSAASSAAAEGAAGVSPPIVSEFDSFVFHHLPQGPTNWSFVIGAMFAFLSQLSSIGKGLQKVGVQTLPELSCQPQILYQYLSSNTWRSGLLLDIAGALCGLASLTILPISVAQPIFCNGLVLLACYSHFYLKEQLARREWRAIGLCFSGTIMLAVTLVPRDWTRTRVGWLQVKLFVVLLMVLPLICACEMGIRRAKRARGVPNRGPNRSAIELLVGLQAGLCIGVGNASLASGLQSTSRSWIDHVARELNGSDIDQPNTEPWPLDTPWPPGVWLHLVCAGAFAVVGSACLTHARHLHACIAHTRPRSSPLPRGAHCRGHMSVCSLAQSR